MHSKLNSTALALAAILLGTAFIGCGGDGSTTPSAPSKRDTVATQSPLIGTWSSNQLGNPVVLTIGADSLQQLSKGTDFRRMVGTWVVDADTLKISFVRTETSTDSMHWVSQDNPFFNYRRYRLAGDELFLTPDGGIEIRYVRGLGQSMAAEPVVAPSIQPAAGQFATSQLITLSCATVSSKIHYTLDGSTPKSSSSLYTTPFLIDTTTTLRAIALVDGRASPISTARFTIASAGLAGTWSRRDTLEFETLIYETATYEQDGTYHSMLVMGKTPQYIRDQGTWKTVGEHVAVTITKMESSPDSATWNALAGLQGNLSYEWIWKIDGTVLVISDTGSGTNETRYVRGTVGNVPLETIAPPVATPIGGYYSTAPLVSLATTTKGATIHYTLDQGTPDSDSPIFGLPFLVDASLTLKAVAIKGKAQSAVTTASYTLPDGIAGFGLIGAWIYRSGTFSETFVYAADGSMTIYNADSTKSGPERFSRTKGYWSLQGTAFSDSLVSSEWSSDGVSWSAIGSPASEVQKGTLVLEGSQLTRSINVPYGHPETTGFVRMTTPSN